MNIMIIESIMNAYYINGNGYIILVLLALGVVMGLYRLLFITP